MKNFLVFSFFLVPLFTFAQIRVLDVGNGWNVKVWSALEVIKKTDLEKYDRVIIHCKEIGFWNGNFSTIEDGNKIILSKTELDYGSINNIACTIVHESRHLMLEKSQTKWDKDFEEFMCYDYELNFAMKIDNIEKWLIEHIIDTRNKYAKIISL